MIRQPHPAQEPQTRLHTLVNWLALAALLALGILAAPAPAPARAGVPEPEAGALLLKACAAAAPLAAPRLTLVTCYPSIPR